MIVGTGVDMIEVLRVGEKVARDNGFREKVFSKNEIDYCEQKANKAEHYAARFAAKEAFLKATGKGLLAGLALSDIEITTDENGKPSLKLSGTFAAMVTENNWIKIHVSLSHLKDLACAFVIIEG